MSGARDLPQVLLDLRIVREQLTGVGRYLVRVFQELQTVAAGDLRVSALVRRGQASPAEGQLVTLPGRAGDCAPLGFAQQWHLPRALEACRYDLFHYTNFDLPRVSRRTPIVATCYDLEPLRHPELFSAKLVWYYRLFARALGRADRVVTISHATAEDVHELASIPRERIVPIHLGVDAHFSAASASAQAAIRSTLDLPPRFVLYVGNTMPHKNLVRVVRAMPAVRASCGPIPLVIAGAPDRYRSSVQEAAGHVGLGEDLRFVGRIADSDLPALISAASVFVFPSLYEGFGLPVLEAMACGTPVVTSDRGSLPEVVGDAARVCDPLDEHAITDALIELLTDTSARSRLREAGLVQAQRFTWARCAAAHRDLYRELLHA